MKKFGVILAGSAMLFAANAKATLIAGWDFVTTTNGGQSSSISNLTGGSLKANFGSGTLYLNGTNGSSSWLASSDSANVAEISDAGGTALNTLSGWGTSTSGTSGLGTYSRAGQKSISFALDMSGYENLSISYAAARTTATTAPSHLWEYSTDGANWTTAQTITNSITGSASTSYTVLSLNPITALDGDSTVFVRFTLIGGSGATGQTRFDNFQFNATAVPEPGTTSAAAMALAALAITVRVRRRKIAA